MQITFTWHAPDGSAANTHYAIPDETVKLRIALLDNTPPTPHEKLWETEINPRKLLREGGE